MIRFLNRSFTIESPPSRGAWIEIYRGYYYRLRDPSPPSRGAWIEISCCCNTMISSAVAPLAGGVD